MGNKRCGRVNVEDLEKLEFLMLRGLSGTDCAKVWKGRAATACFYFKVLKAVRAGEEIPVTKHTYNPRTVQAFCEKHGYKYIPKQEEQSEEKHEEQTQIESVDSVCEVFGMREEVSAAEAFERMKEAFLNLAAEAEAFAARMKEVQIVEKHHAG